MRISSLLSKLGYLFTSNNGTTMTKIIALFSILGLAACSNALPVGYNSCGADGCAQDTTDTKPDNNGSGDGEYSCEELTQLAATACNGDILSVDCANGEFECQAASSGSGGSGSSSSSNVTIVIEVSSDGTVSASDGDESTPDCNDEVDNDFDGLIDFGDDPGCTSASDTSEVDSSGGGDTGDGCDISAGGIEFCDGTDNDCNGVVDDGDFDGDGYISEDCADTYDGPSPELATDCNDSGAYQGWIHSALIHPGQIELADWVDEDCNGNDEDFATESQVEADGCQLICNSDASLPVTEFFETDGDAELECVSAFTMADDSSDANPLDPSVSFTYSGVTYSGVAVTCEDSEATQGNPNLWVPITDIQSEMCSRTPALTTADCLDLF